MALPAIVETLLLTEQEKLKTDAVRLAATYALIFCTAHSRTVILGLKCQKRLQTDGRLDLVKAIRSARLLSNLFVWFFTLSRGSKYMA